MIVRLGLGLELGLALGLGLELGLGLWLALDLGLGLGLRLALGLEEMNNLKLCVGDWRGLEVERINTEPFLLKCVKCLNLTFFATVQIH